MKMFRVTGTIPQGTVPRMRFTRYIAAEDEATAREHLLSILGSKHRVKRRFVRITSFEEVEPGEDPGRLKAKRGSA